MSFEHQLEFVQALANPYYLSYLAQTGQLEDVRLVNYLDHLREIWTKNQEYAKFISFPASFHHLDLLKSADFRRALIHNETAERLAADLINTWKSKPMDNEKIVKNEPV